MAQSTSVILQCILLVMNFLWLVAVVFLYFDRFSNENKADLFENAVLYPKNENLVSHGSIDENGLSSEPTLPHKSAIQNLQNGGSQSAGLYGIKPRLLDVSLISSGNGALFGAHLY